MDRIKYSEKEIAIFNGLISLMREGANPYSIKVSDIAIASQVGKGTIYDYFESKEEAISRAIIYNINSEIKDGFRRIESKDNFKDRFYEILEIIADNLENSLSIFNILLSAGSIREFYEYLKDDKYDLSKFVSLVNIGIDDLLKLGFHEGLIKTSESNYYQITAVQGAICGFSNYISRKDLYPNTDIKDAMDTSYKILVKSLS